MRDGDLTVQQLQDPSAAAVLMEREWAPCRYYCPVHADVRKYIEFASQGRFADAIDVIRANLPFAAICGRICHHPCEANCRRSDVDAAVAIREIKRFVAETQKAGGSTVRKAAKQDRAAVAIVGGGPAGMAAALELAKLGYRPTVFEKFPVAGGIPATAIPRYRLPREVIQIDVDWICAHGVQLVTGVEIGKDKTIERLKTEGFAAVLIAAGLAKSRLLNLPGGDHPRVRPVLEFLTDLSFDRPGGIGKEVIVIGGGNVACDAARSAVRLGAAVTMMCLEDEAEMPAWEWERRESVEEGIKIIHRRGPVEVLVKDGRITGLKARKVTRVFDQAKRFDPRYDDADVIELSCDSVIMAIGQQADMGFARSSSLKVDHRGRLAWNSVTCQTSLEWVFACGEIVAPPGSAVEACASGQRAVKAIDLYLSGKPIKLDDALPAYIGKISPAVGEQVIKVERCAVPTEPAEFRKTNWTEGDHTYSEALALREARRCMGCGSGAEVLVDKCAACLTCLRVCPFDIPRVTDVARIDSALCQACGICVAECPNNAIVYRGKARSWLTERTVAALAGQAGLAIAYICGHNATAQEWQGQTDVPGVVEIYVPSMAGVGTADLLAALELGAAAVVVIATRQGRERYPRASARIRSRVKQARSLLQEIGLDAEKVKLLELV